VAHLKPKFKGLKNLLQKYSLPVLRRKKSTGWPPAFHKGLRDAQFIFIVSCYLVFKDLIFQKRAHHMQKKPRVKKSLFIFLKNFNYQKLQEENWNQPAFIDYYFDLNWYAKYFSNPLQFEKVG